MVCTSAYSLLVASLICVPGKQHTSLKNASNWQMGGSVPLRGESSTIITGHLLLLLLFVIKGAYQADLVCPSISPDGTGPSSSVCRAVKQTCKGTSGFRGRLFLLCILSIAGFHSSTLLASLPSVCAGGGFLGCFAVCPPHAALGSSYLAPSQPP